LRGINITKDIRDLFTKIAAADVVKIDDLAWVIDHKIDINLEDLPRFIRGLEDFEKVFETTSDDFDAWDIVQNSTRINDSEWSVNGSLISFYLIQPA